MTPKDVLELIRLLVLLTISSFRGSWGNKSLVPATKRAKGSVLPLALHAPTDLF